MARPERIRLGDLLIQEALLTPAQLDDALVDQKKTGRKLGRIFIDRQWVTEVQIAKAVARQLRSPFIDLTARNIPPRWPACCPRRTPAACARCRSRTRPARRCGWPWPTPPT